MLIAEKKKRDNIAEYILYMWQVEDMVRACKFDMDTIEEKIISQFDKPESVLREIRNWYANIILMMHEEGIKEKGHLKLINKTIEELNGLHQAILKKQKDKKYLEQYHWAVPNIKEFQRKMENHENSNEIEVCFNALYALLLLRIQNKDVSNGTREAMSTFSNLLAVLAHRYKQTES
jgi:hypothetical protein